MSRFSIILPVRNGGNYVRECIKSILGQTVHDFNLVVLDNHSVDGTVEWIESLREERIIVYRSDRPLSIEENWARIKEIPKNTFMTMIGHDDVLLSNYLETMDGLIVKHPEATLYQTHFRFIDEHGSIVRQCLPMDETQHAHEFLACQFMRTIDSTGTGYMMRSADFDSLGGMPVQYPNLIFSDFELWVKLMLRGYKATSQAECFSYRVHQSVSRITNGMVFQEAFFLYLDFLRGIMGQYPLCHKSITRYAPHFLMFYCESLSHRLLRIPVSYRSVKVGDFINKCREYASFLAPDQPFRPQDQWKILLAGKLDRTAAGRILFRTLRSIMSRL